jgi:hypothetical protein
MFNEIKDLDKIIAQKANLAEEDVKSYYRSKKFEIVDQFHFDILHFKLRLEEEGIELDEDHSSKLESWAEDLKKEMQLLEQDEEEYCDD